MTFLIQTGRTARGPTEEKSEYLSAPKRNGLTAIAIYEHHPSTNDFRICLARYYEMT